MSDGHNLVDALEAYLGLSEPSRSLYLQDVLKREVEDQIRFVNGSPTPLEKSKRTQYMASMPNAHFEALKHDIVYELLKRGRSSTYTLPVDLTDSAVTASQLRDLRPIVPSFIDNMGHEHFRTLIAEFVCELDNRLATVIDSSDTGDSDSMYASSLHSGVSSVVETSQTELTEASGLMSRSPLEPYDGWRILHPSPLMVDVRPLVREDLARSRFSHVRSRPTSIVSRPPPLPATITEEDDHDDESGYDADGVAKYRPAIKRSSSHREFSKVGADMPDARPATLRRSSAESTLDNARAASENWNDQGTDILNAPATAPSIYTKARNSVRSSWRMSNSYNRRSIKRDSSVSSHHSFSSAKSFATAQASLHSAEAHNMASSTKSSEWLDFLRSLSLIPDQMSELNWSGKGQHVEYEPSEENDIPIVEENLLGHTASAVVQSVRCKRIRLARKTISCNRKFRREEAIKEVEHLQRVKHCHVVRVVGTYVVKQNLSILLYPATEWNLETFIVSLKSGEEVAPRRDHLVGFVRCLLETMNFLHDSLIKHMDIKPKNLLVRDIRRSVLRSRIPAPLNHYKVYIADFGIARSYRCSEDAETSGRTSFTKRYAAPEVVDQAPRGFSADIFSMGCVFLEIIAAVFDTELASSEHSEGSSAPHADELDKIRENNPDYDDSYQANVTELKAWLVRLGCRPKDGAFSPKFCALVAAMINYEAHDRPTTEDILMSSWLPIGCSDCHSDQDPFESASQSNE
ncbi:kinase-like protein [Pseudovirgaria hyperparasitica]|uniref:Kinase-like protein n=1 Tax=Pseudovirgaria hyperparasitica TaxID=470096 RepID=A0A6A6WGB5_9PEZI|nr:kinase-like protein [Pseudovirgaria hyperparasitica]KAF2760181.1 kinase-like protein [Pseudovirgaria hyperparasitica]